MKLFFSTTRFFCGLALALILLGTIPGAGLSRPVSPRDGGPMPESCLKTLKEEKGAFRPGLRWLKSRRSFLHDKNHFMPFPDASAGGSGAVIKGSTLPPVTGDFVIPVITGAFSDFSETPESVEELQRILFDGPAFPGTFSEYYSENSFGNLDVSGKVYGWAELSQPEIYYTGPVNHGLTPGVSHTDEMIAETVAALDGVIDFGLYDNDGPDGVANSGDDDGYVDLLVIVHPARGGECGGPDHIWSHSWQYSSWNEEREPLETQDISAGGGHIVIDDYFIAPAVSCEGGLIEIGVFCHEFGHSLGLPDLYDYNGGGRGIGFWGLMGSGNWNTPKSPAHLSAWSREQLGWIDPVEIGWVEEERVLESINEGGTVLKLVLPSKRFRRMPNPFPVGGKAMICAYTEAEASARGWNGGAGYGNGWNESIFHPFHTDGNGSLIFEYNIGLDVEPEYDNVYLYLDAGGSSHLVAQYTGTVYPFREEIDLEPFLPQGPVDFIMRFLFVSDFNFSDEDNRYDSMEGWSLNIDNVGLYGGGNEYTCDFEKDEGGWRCGSDPAEYFLVENRQRGGFDMNLPGSGLLVWHAENSIAFSDLGNSGGYSNTQARGLVLQEADGQFDLLAYLVPPNTGDKGDPFPGSTGNSDFDSYTVPSSRGNDGLSTPVSIRGISGGSAFFRAGMPAPVISSVEPGSVVRGEDQTVILDIAGSGFLYGSTCFLSNGATIIPAMETEWFGEGSLEGSFEAEQLYRGLWDLTVISGDAQTSSLPGALAVESVFGPFRVESMRSTIDILWDVYLTEGLTGCMLYRKSEGTGFVPVRADTFREGSGEFIWSDSGVIPEIEYSYRITAFYPGRSEDLILAGPWSIEDEPFSLDRAYPNPFAESVSVDFFLDRPMMIEMLVYDVSGRRIDSIERAPYTRGENTIVWIPRSGTSASVYFIILDNGTAKKTVKVVFLP
ncbi:MAG: M6 family metalloprotease domain-containing protein [Candidatus Krumholzibacteriota bacterium]|nr:M6 family metalloprotease domain-containing protein [Candidatus Krumholzibacteriota bacterium]